MLCKSTLLPSVSHIHSQRKDRDSSRVAAGMRSWHRYRASSTGRIDEAILGVYLSGSNTGRIRGALAPLVRVDHYRRMWCLVWSPGSKTMSRAWRERDLSSEDIPGSLVRNGSLYERRIVWNGSMKNFDDGPKRSRTLAVPA
jgi:hypothetical protein